MARFANFRNRAQRRFRSFRNRTRGFRSGARRVYSSKTLGMKTSTLVKIAIVGILGFMFKDKIKPYIEKFTKK